jgi:TonB family protein
MKTLRHLVVLSGLVALAAGSASAQHYERFGRNDRQSLNLDPAKINLIASARAETGLPALSVAFTITVQGEPTAIRVLTSTGDERVDALCVASLQATRFEPKLVDGVAVSSERTMSLSPKVTRR